MRIHSWCHHFCLRLPIGRRSTGCRCGRVLWQSRGTVWSGCGSRESSRPLRLQWAVTTEQVAQCYDYQKGVIGRLARFDAQHNIPMMLLKGYGLSLNYPVPQHRPCGDIDIWLYGRQEEADDLLRREKGIAIDEDKHHHTVFHVDGVMVENHYDFLNIHAHRSNCAIERECSAPPNLDN